MAYHPSDVRARQHRSSTEPLSSRPPFPTIPPSLIPGHRHRQTISTTAVANGLMYSGPGPRTGTGNFPMPKVPATTFLAVNDIPQYYSANASTSRDSQPPLPPLPQPQPRPPAPPRHQQPVVPPLPPKTPIITPPSITPVLPPKPPLFIPPPPTLPRPNLSPRSQSQPPPRTSRGASSLPPPPLPPPKPLGARSASFNVTRSTFPQPPITPSAKPSFTAKASPDTDDPDASILPSVAPPAERPLMNEEEELELALELSAHAEREHAKSLLSHDEELARALEKSLLDSPPRPVHHSLHPDQLVVDIENVPSPSSGWGSHSPSPTPISHAPPLPVPSPVDVQLREDEAFARRLEADYESGRTTPTTEKSYDADPKLSQSPSLPCYADAVGRETVVKHFEPDVIAPPQVSHTSAPTNERPSVPDGANALPGNSPSPAQRTSPRPESLALNPSSEEEEDSEYPSSSPQPSRPFVTPNEFVEPELLYGVSFGFQTPPMENLEMRDPLPNIIALPYGKSPPMHIRATSWRQLLKLMAKLSATQIEPSVEAVAMTKGELRLRTVIQFFKVHQNSLDWRTVIYLTIDHPPPPGHKYTNLDVNVLPYSYGLSTLPALLRDGPESNISKYYTIPASPRTPLPKLPISMPNMAIYLTSALEDSRRALSDSSSGFRRLAKMIDQFYPNQESQGAVGEEVVRRRGGRALIGRLMGRTTRPQGGRNADVYDLVTPFVPDEWG